MLINELVEGNGNLIVIGNSMFFQNNSGQTRQSSVFCRIYELMHLLALKKGLKCLAVMVFRVLKIKRKLIKFDEKV